jgi:hypothetical protein
MLLCYSSKRPIANLAALSGILGRCWSQLDVQRYSFVVPIILMITWIGKLAMTMGHHALIITDSVTFLLCLLRQ